jgi:hypothetical protein
MRLRFFSPVLLVIYTTCVTLVCTITVTGCELATASDWVLLSEDSEGQPTYIDAGSIHLRDQGVAVYKRVVGDPSAPDRVEFLQALDCVKLRWAFLTLDESVLDSIAGMSFSSEEWSLLELTPANQALLDQVCEGYPPARWIRVLRKNTDAPGELKEVWVDRETITGPAQDSVRTEVEDMGFSEDVFRSWSRWVDASPDSGYLMIQADVACDLGTFRYLESARYSNEGELILEGETPDFWLYMFRDSFGEQVFGVVCEMGDFFHPGSTPGTSPGGG